jgi:hypothetical protein
MGATGSARGQIKLADTHAGVRTTGILEGGGGVASGVIRSDGALGPVAVGGSIQGGNGTVSGMVTTEGGTIAALSLGGSLIGADGTQSGTVFSSGPLGSVRIKGDVRGGTGVDSGQISCGDRITGPVVIRGNLVGGSGDRSGILEANGVVGAVVNGVAIGVTIGGDVRGGSGSSSGRIEDIDTLTSVTVGGSVLSGTGSNSGQISSDRALGPVVIKGDVIGTSAHPVILAALSGPGKSSLAIQSVFVGGRVEFAEILAGFDDSLTPRDPDVQIGSVTVGGDWITSSISAGIDPKNGKLGDGDDQVITGKNDPNILSKIGSIKIGGAVLGTPSSVSSSDSFGFEAEQISSVSIGGVVLPLQAGAHNDNFPLGVTADFNLHEL